MDLSKIDPARLPFIPAGVPPNGTLSNLVNPPSRVHEIKTVIYVTVSFMFVPLVLRLYTRARITRNFGADDCRYSILDNPRGMTDSTAVLAILAAVSQHFKIYTLT
jgi:hypothetical protein